MMNIFAQKDILRLYFLDIEGAPAATMLIFDWNDSYYLYNSGFDPDAFGHLSPGNILTTYTIKEAIEKGKKTYDFLRGEEIYKFRLGGVAEAIFDLEITRS